MERGKENMGLSLLERARAFGYNLALMPILLLTSVILVLGFFICLIPRSVVWAVAKMLRPELESFLVGDGAIFATTPGNKAVLNILITMVVKGDIPGEVVRKMFQKRIMEERDPLTGELLYEGLKQTWESYLGYAFWRTDPEFDLKNHVRDYDYGGELQLPSPCTEKDFYSVLGRLDEEPWDRERSPWEFLMLRDYVGEDGGKCTAMILRIEHTRADGYTLLRIVKLLFGSECAVPKFRMAERKFSLWERVFLPLKSVYDLMKDLISIQGMEQLQWTSFKPDEPIIVSVSPPVQVELIKRIKNHWGTSYAAVTNTAILGAIERVLRLTGQKVPERLGCEVIAPRIGHPHKGLAVFASVIPASLPFKANSPLERLKLVDEALRKQTGSAAFLALSFFVNLTAYYPMFARRLLTQAFIAQGLSIGFSNFPCTTSFEYYDVREQEMTKLIPGVGTWRPLGMYVATGGVNNKQVFKFAVNRCVFTSVEAAQDLGLYVEEEIQALVEAMEGNKKCQ